MNPTKASAIALGVPPLRKVHGPIIGEGVTNFALEISWSCFLGERSYPCLTE